MGAVDARLSVDLEQLVACFQSPVPVGHAALYHFRDVDAVVTRQVWRACAARNAEAEAILRLPTKKKIKDV